MSPLVVGRGLHDEKIMMHGIWFIWENRIVESFGANVIGLKPGDKCIPVWQAECQKCNMCKSSKTNICEVFMFNWGSGVMASDKKTTRFTRALDGKPIYHFFGISVFSQYTVVDEACCAKINNRADLTKICLLGCGIPTGLLLASLTSSSSSSPSSWCHT